jgi:hypothetical protein
MATLTVITDDGASEVEGRIDDHGRVLVDASTLTGVLEWQLKPEGLCRGDLCVPVHGRLEPVDGAVDLVTAAGLLRRPALVDASSDVVVLGVSADDRRRALEGKQLPDLSLPDLDGVMQPVATWVGKKKLLVVFASW